MKLQELATTAQVSFQMNRDKLWYIKKRES